jgi:hypothetical protein
MKYSGKLEKRQIIPYVEAPDQVPRFDAFRPHLTFTTDYSKLLDLHEIRWQYPARLRYLISVHGAWIPTSGFSG